MKAACTSEEAVAAPTTGVTLAAMPDKLLMLIFDVAQHGAEAPRPRVQRGAPATVLLRKRSPARLLSRVLQPRAAVAPEDGVDPETGGR